MVDGIYLHQLARCSDSRAPWIVPADAWLPGSVKAVVAPQDAAHTAETNVNSLTMLVTNVREVVPDDLGAAFER